VLKTPDHPNIVKLVEVRLATRMSYLFPDTKPAFNDIFQQRRSKVRERVFRH